MTTIEVRLVAVRVACERCLDRARIETEHADGFTRHVLQPLASWWVAHLEPCLVGFVAITNGEHQEWAATDRRNRE